MKFGAVAPKDALGATAVHSIRQGGLVLKKGTLIGAAEVAALEAAGIKDIVVARLEPGDVSEDVAAAEIAKKVAGEGVHVDRAFTGRANLFAQVAGVLVVDKDAVDRLNRVDEAITFATLPAYKPVVAGEMIATVKIIPFAVAKDARDTALGGVHAPLLRVAPYRIRKVGVVSTILPGLAAKVIEKTLKITSERLAPCRRHDHRRAARAARSCRARPRARRGSQRRRRARHRVRRLRDRRPPRRDPGGAGVDRRPHRAFRHAGRSRQSVDDRRRWRTRRARRAGLRPQPEGKRLRLGADAASRRPAGGARGHYRARRRRLAHGNRHPAAAAQGAGARKGPQHRSNRARRRPLEPHGRCRTSFWKRSPADRSCASSPRRRSPRGRGR